MDPVLAEAKQRFDKTLEYLKSELASIRAGRASPGLIENVVVSVYGSKMKLMEVGTISAVQTDLLTVQVWDISIIENVIKALQEANLGFNPSFEGQIIRLPIPPLTEERRNEFIKLAQKKQEQTRVEMRQIRQEIRENWEKEQKANRFGSDEFDRRAKILQELIDKMSAQVDELGKAKIAELSQV